MATPPSKPVKTVTINYTDPAPGQNPQLQILNDPAGNYGEIQFKGRSGNFAATNNLAWDGNSQTLNIRGNVRLTGNIVGNLVGNPNFLKLIGGNAGDVLTTDGTGNVSWQSVIDLEYGNSDVANYMPVYLPTYNGNISASNANLGNSVTANFFIGDMIGTALGAVVAATAYSVDGANVNGMVANANYAETSNTANQSNVANTANIANSVDVANVSGLGNIATINLNGNVSTVLSGDGTWIEQNTSGGLPIANGNSIIDISTIDGNVTLDANGKVWTFDTTANLTLPGAVIGTTPNNNGYIEWSGNSSGDNNGYTTLRLVPDDTLVGNDQYLIIDPTSPSHIHIRAGGTQDDSSAQLFLGGEKSHVTVWDNGGARMQTETEQTTGTFNLTSADFSSATVDYDSGQASYVVTINDPNQACFDAVWNLTDISFIEVYDGSNYYTLTYGSGSNTPYPAGPIVFAIAGTPPSSPISVQTLYVQNKTTRQNYAEVSGSDFTVNVYDDVRITGSDVVSIRNRSGSNPITIISDYDGLERTWEFNSNAVMTTPSSIILNNGNITFPDATEQFTAWTGNVNASNVVGNLPVRSDVKNTSGATLVKGTPVYIVGNVGSSDVIEIAPCRADTQNKMGCVGILEQTLNDNDIGTMLSIGQLTNIDTSSYTIGQQLYVAPAGGLTGTRPTGSNIVQSVGVISRVNGSTGVIEVNIWNINGLPNLNEGNVWVGTAGNGYPVQQAIGNIATINLDGNTSNVLYGNGVFAAVATVPSSIANGNSNVAIATANGNVVTTVNAASILTVYSGGIKVAGSGIIQGPGGASSITLNNNGANIPTANITAFANITGAGNALNVVNSANIGGNLTVTGNISGSTLLATNASGNEGGELQLAKPPNGTLSGGVTVDAYQNQLRFFEQGGSARGLYIDLANSPAGVSAAVGYRDIPQVAASNTTLSASDAGKHYYSTSTGNFTLTIPNNATTSFSTGTAISIVMQGAGNILVNAASGVTLYMAGNSTAANRVVGAYGMATLMKVATDTWFINGTGVS